MSFNVKDFIIHYTPEMVYDEVVTKSFVPVILDFYADWCGPCQLLTPNLEKAVEQGKGKFILVKVNVDENPDLAEQFEIEGIPFVVLVKEGKRIAEFSGNNLVKLNDMITKV
jgi:putative thioredoxin